MADPGGFVYNLPFGRGPAPPAPGGHGGIRRGHLHGVTADERPCRTLRDRVVITDLHATIFHTLGIPPTLAYEVEQRPFYVTEDGRGEAIRSLLARG